jgi:hypothetical protein
LTDIIDDLQGQLEGLRTDNLEIRERLGLAERLLEGGEE